MKMMRSRRCVAYLLAWMLALSMLFTPALPGMQVWADDPVQTERVVSDVPAQTWLVITSPTAIFRESVTEADGTVTDYWQADEVIFPNEEGNIIITTSQSGARNFGTAEGLILTDEDGAAVSGATITQPLGNANRTVTISGLESGKTYNLTWPKQWANANPVCNVTLNFSVAGESDYSRMIVQGLSTVYDYTGSEIKPEPQVSVGGVTLTKDTDYTLTYEGDVTEPGTVNLTVTGIGEYAELEPVTKSYRIEIIIQDWITSFMGTAAADLMTEADATSNRYAWPEPVEFNEDGTVVLTYVVKQVQNYLPARVVSATGEELDGVTIEDTKGNERTVTITGLQKGTTYQLFWPKDGTVADGSVNPKPERDVYLTFRTISEEEEAAKAARDAAVREAEELLGEADALIENDYTEETYAAVTEAAEALEAVIADETSTADDITAAADALAAAMDELKTKAEQAQEDAEEAKAAAELANAKVDLAIAILDSALSGIKSADYTKATYDAFQAALTAAKAALSNPEAAVEDLTKAAGDLKAAKDALVKKAANTLSVKTKKVSLKASVLKKKAQTVAVKKAFTVTGAKGTVSYKKTSGNAKVTVAKTGKITAKKGLKKGTYKIKVTVTAAGNDDFKAGTKKVTVTVAVK